MTYLTLLGDCGILKKMSDLMPYVASKHTRFLYPGAGDPLPPSGSKVLLLTLHGICVVGVWGDGFGYLGWHPLIGRDAEKEEAVLKHRRCSASERPE